MSEDDSWVEDLTDDGDVDNDPITDDDVDVEALRMSSQAGDIVELGDDETGGADVPQQGQSSSQTVRRVQSAPLAPLLDMVEGRVPMFLVHKSHQHSQHIPELLAAARRRVRGRAGLGVVVRLPKLAPAAANTYLASCTHAAMKIADPEIYTITGSGSPTPPPHKAKTRYSWMNGIPATLDPAWVQEVLESQAAAGANVFLSASGWVADTTGRTELARAMDWVRASRAELGDENMFVNLTLPSTWLTNTDLRSALKQELVESNEPLWWLRFYWPVVEPRYGQLTERAILDGYRDLATTATLEDKVLVLPNSGLTGWMGIAWGAQGFSTGTSWPEQMYGAQPIRRSTPGRPKAAPVERYFDRTVLHSVPHAAHLTLRTQPTHLTCACRFCRRLGAAATYEQPTANLHYLLECASLTGDLNTRRPGHQALRTVRDASAFAADLPTPLTANARPLHLPEWQARLP
ncbi:MAG: hypothetical protein WBG57_13720 [Ornithinimicrobium sp.]